jgi:hypothetical protein
MKAFFIRTPFGLMPDPADERSRECLQGVKLGQSVEVEVKEMTRSLQHLRLYWALCGKIGDAIGVHRENISDVLKLRTGHYVTVQTKAGLEKFPRSIAFGKMSQQEFHKFFDSCCAHICAEWLPHLKGDALRDDIMRMTGIPVEEKAA